MNDDLDDIYNLKLYPKHLRTIVRIILKFENSLSDGFEWYGDVKSMTKLASELYKLQEK